MGSNEPTFSYKKGSSLFCITIIVLTNRYGHPDPHAIERLRENGSKVLCTIESGEIIVYGDYDCIQEDEIGYADGSENGVRYETYIK